MKTANAKKIACPSRTCDRHFHINGDLDKHLVASHRGELLLECTNSACKIYFATTADRSNHIKSVHDPICYAVAQGIRATCIRGEDGCFLCPVSGCLIQSANRGEITAHVSTAHHTGALQFREGVRTEPAAKSRRPTKASGAAKQSGSAALPPPATMATAMDVDNPVVDHESQGLAPLTPPPSSSPQALPGTLDHIIRDPDLATMGFAVHTEWHVAICLTCKFCVPADDLRTHAIEDGNIVDDAKLIAAI